MAFHFYLKKNRSVCRPEDIGALLSRTDLSCQGITRVFVRTDYWLFPAKNYTQGILTPSGQHRHSEDPFDGKSLTYQHQILYPLENSIQQVSKLYLYTYSYPILILMNLIQKSTAFLLGPVFLANNCGCCRHLRHLDHGGRQVYEPGCLRSRIYEPGFTTLDLRECIAETGPLLRIHVIS